MNAARASEWDHTSLTVEFLDSSVNFYQEAFGYVSLLANSDMRDTIRRITGTSDLCASLVQLRAPFSPHTLELISFSDVPEQRRQSAPLASGTAHVALRIKDFERGLEVAQELGAVLLGDVTDFGGGRLAAYLREPGGSIFELSRADVKR